MFRIACVAACSMLAFGANATTYYVAPPPAGSNFNLGTLAQPWATLQHAANQVGPGDVVEVRTGNYAGMNLTSGGAAGLPITFRAFAGESPVIDAPAASPSVGINIETASHVVIEGFRLVATGNYGIRIIDSDDVQVRNNRIDGMTQSGVLASSADDVVIEDNHITASVINAGVLYLGSGDRLVVRRNELLNNHGGIVLIADAKFGPPGLIRDAIIEANRIRIVNGSLVSAIAFIGVQDSTVKNNLAYNVPRFGILLWKDVASGSSTGNLIVNNTIVLLDIGRFAIYALEASTGTTIRNNVLYNANTSATTGSISMSSDSFPGTSSNRNVVVDRFEITTPQGDTMYSLANWRTQTGQDFNSLLGNPVTLFVSLATGNFRLPAGSPAIDAGEARNDVLLDVEGLPRPAFAGWDIGAYEFRDLQFADGFESPP